MTNNQIKTHKYWNILIVDDIKNLHKITKNAFFEEEVLKKEINFLSAYDEEEAINLLDKYNKEIALIILDMVMLNGNGGIKVLKHLTEDLKNNITQVILRTGYPGREQVKNININYPQVVILEKGETDVDLLIRLVTEAIEKYNNKLV